MERTRTPVQTEEETDLEVSAADIPWSITWQTRSSKRCAACDETKALGEFWTIKRNGRLYPQSLCKPCSNESAKLSHRRHPQSRTHDSSEARKARDRERWADGDVNRQRARAAVNYAIRKGTIIPPACCELCERDPGLTPAGRRRLRADHFVSYEPEHWLTVRFLCPVCDGRLMRIANDARRRAALASSEAA